MRDLLLSSKKAAAGLTFFGSHTFGKNETNGRWHRHMKGKLQPGGVTSSDYYDGEHVIRAWLLR